MDKSIQNSGQLKKTIQILLPFIKQPWKQFTLTEIKALTNNRSHHYVYEALERFSSMIKKERRGNTNTYRIDEDAKGLDLLALAELEMRDKAIHLPRNVIQQIQDRVKDPFYTLLITGSYAKGTQKRGSDLDVAIIIPDNQNKKSFEIALKEGDLTVPEVHGFVFTAEEFHQMLVNKEFNLGKECARHHIIMHGIEPYYKILLRGLQDGFKG